MTICKQFIPLQALERFKLFCHVLFLRTNQIHIEVGKSEFRHTRKIIGPVLDKLRSWKTSFAGPCLITFIKSSCPSLIFGNLKAFWASSISSALCFARPLVGNLYSSLCQNLILFQPSNISIFELFLQASLSRSNSLPVSSGVRRKWHKGKVARAGMQTVNARLVVVVVKMDFSSVKTRNSYSTFLGPRNYKVTVMHHGK